VSVSLTVQADDLDLQVEVWFDRYDSFDGKAGFGYRITAGGTTVTGDDLRAPKPDLAPALESLLVFLSTWVSALRYPDSEHADMFPASLRPWAESLDNAGHGRRQSVETRRLSATTWQ